MQEVKYIDTHSHIHFSDFDGDRTEMLERMREHGVGTIAIGTDKETSKQALELAEKYPDVVVGATVGVHPNDTDEEFDKEAFTNCLTSDVKQFVVGVGECGLDYFRNDIRDVCEKARQEKKFMMQIEFAHAHDLPLMLHIRPSKNSEDAHGDALNILENYKKEYGEKLRGTCHFFTGSTEIALKYIDLGFHISFPGVITFAAETHDAVRQIPLDRILSETDAPYATPVPHRGKRNEPTFVVEIVKKIAEIKQMDEEIVREQLVRNAQKVFAI